MTLNNIAAIDSLTGCAVIFPNGAIGAQLTILPSGIPGWIVGGAFSCASLNVCSIDALSDVNTSTTVPLVGQMLAWNGTNWVPTTTPNFDFWRSGAGGTTLPDGVNDITENIRRNGNVALNTNALSTLDVNGSYAVATRTNNAAAVTVAATDSTVVLGLAGAQTVTLPAAATATRRILNIVNPTSTTKTISSYTDLNGAIVTTIAPNSSITIQSDGTIWRQTIGGTPGATKKFRVVQALVLGNNTITHNLNLAATPVIVEVRDNTTGTLLTSRVITENTNSTVIDVGAAVASARITIIG